MIRARAIYKAGHSQCIIIAVCVFIKCLVLSVWLSGHKKPPADFSLGAGGIAATRGHANFSLN